MSKNGKTPVAPVAQDPEKLARVQKELDHLGEIFKEIDPNKRDFVQRQIEQLAWFNVSIADLQAKVDQWGTLISYNNGGNQTGIKPNPDVKTLLDYQKCSNTIVRTLIPLVPNREACSKLRDWFMDLGEEPDDDIEDRQSELNRQIDEAVRKDKEWREAGRVDCCDKSQTGTSPRQIPEL